MRSSILTSIEVVNQLQIKPREIELTEQIPERFINEHPRIDVSLLRLYFVSAELPATPQLPEDHLYCTALWRGYIATWRLNPNGTLDLLQFEFPQFDDQESDIQTFEPQPAVGEFTLTFRPFFYGPNTKIPFVNGRVIEDRPKWEIDDQTIEAEAIKALNDSGLIVRTDGGTAFVPKSLLLNPSSKLTTMIGQRLKCEINARDDKRGTFILKQIESAQ